MNVTVCVLCSMIIQYSVIIVVNTEVFQLDAQNLIAKSFTIIIFEQNLVKLKYQCT